MSAGFPNGTNKLAKYWFTGDSGIKKSSKHTLFFLTGMACSGTTYLDEAINNSAEAAD